MIFNTFSRENHCVQILTETPYVCQKCINEKIKNVKNFMRIYALMKKKKGYMYVHMDCAHIKLQMLYIPV